MSPELCTMAWAYLRPEMPLAWSISTEFCGRNVFLGLTTFLLPPEKSKRGGFQTAPGIFLASGSEGGSTIKDLHTVQEEVSMVSWVARLNSRCLSLHPVLVFVRRPASVEGLGFVHAVSTSTSFTRLFFLVITLNPVSQPAQADGLKPVPILLGEALLIWLVTATTSSGTSGTSTSATACTATCLGACACSYRYAGPSITIGGLRVLRQV